MFGAAVAVDSHVRDGSLRQAATEAGKTLLLYEGGEAQRFDERSIAVATNGVLRVLSHLGMVDIDVEDAPEPAIASGSGWIRATRSGIVHATEPLGALVEKGQVVAVLRGPFGEQLARLKARWPGVVIGIAQDPLANRGDAICHIARIQDAAVADVALAALPEDAERGTEEAVQP